MIRAACLGAAAGLLLSAGGAPAWAPAQIVVEAAPGTSWLYSVNGVDHPPMIPGEPIYVADGDQVTIAVNRADGPAGDANGDGRVGMADAIYALRVAAGH